jgi:hypothetical protein
MFLGLPDPHPDPLGPSTDKLNLIVKHIFTTLKLLNCIY